eukprot:TRINITY_DN28659_c0_g1_i1.p1 TRINITY_DN28659_c0_g1~~TRINITY_DN28659_c0_g1_i1.p1  ORF type:complete len:392 (+),score=31.87 TRINITY_DN28659_c0_g1_i1:91-1266(+)
MEDSASDCSLECAPGKNHHRRSLLRERVRRSFHEFQEADVSVRLPESCTPVQRRSHASASTALDDEEDGGELCPIAEGKPEDATPDMGKLAAAHELRCQAAMKGGQLPRPTVPWDEDSFGLSMSSVSAPRRRGADGSIFCWFQPLMPSACCSTRIKSGREQLNHLDRAAQDDLRYWCNVEFEGSSREADMQLQAIWNAAGLGSRIDSVTDGAQWTRLGFRSYRPTWDICPTRFVLDQFLYLAVTYPHRLASLTKASGDYDYPLAISSFTLTHILLVFFDLYDFEAASPLFDAPRADAVQLANFLGLARNTVGGCCRLLHELHCVLLEALSRSWQAGCDDGRSKNVRYLKGAFEDIFEANAAFWRRARTLAELSELRWCSERHSSVKRRSAD